MTAPSVHNGLFKRLRRSRIGLALAFAVVVINLLAVTDHLGAAAAGIGAIDENGRSLIALCRSPATSASGQTDGADDPRPAACPICLAASLAASATGAIAPAVTAPEALWRPVTPSACAALADPRPFRPYGVTRGPPVG